MTFKSLLDFQPDQGYLVQEQFSEFSLCRVGQSSIQCSNLSGDPSSSLPGEEAALPASLAVELLPTVLPDLVAVLPVPAQAAHGRRSAAGRRSALQVFFFQTYFWIFGFWISFWPLFSLAGVLLSNLFFHFLIFDFFLAVVQPCRCSSFKLIFGFFDF